MLKYLVLILRLAPNLTFAQMSGSTKACEAYAGAQGAMAQKTQHLF